MIGCTQSTSRGGIAASSLQNTDVLQRARFLRAPHAGGAPAPRPSAPPARPARAAGSPSRSPARSPAAQPSRLQQVWDSSRRVVGCHVVRKVSTAANDTSIRSQKNLFGSSKSMLSTLAKTATTWLINKQDRQMCKSDDATITAERLGALRRCHVAAVLMRGRETAEGH